MYPNRFTTGAAEVLLPAAYLAAESELELGLNAVPYGTEETSDAG